MLSLLVGGILAAAVSYNSPVDYDIALAGNFGEPRLNHFHGGIDIKTGGVEGKRIYSIGDGYVSRVTVGIAGFGKAVYITHPEGYTSVYCHLKSFSPRISRLLWRWQNVHQSYKADVRLAPSDCPVSAGQLIALSGNTGASTAPHLHLEIHDTRTGWLLDPLDFLGHSVVDGLAPVAHAFMAYPKKGEGTFLRKSVRQSFGFSSHNLERRFTAWGKVGFGIWANDYMEATYNRYGVRETVLQVDGREVFHSVVDNISPAVNRQVNSWGDYPHYLHTGVWYIKSFQEPDNTLPFITTDSTCGYVNFCENRDYHLKYILKDRHGNMSQYSFIVSGEPCPVSRVADVTKTGLFADRDRVNVYARPGIQLIMPAGVTPCGMKFVPDVRRRDGHLSHSYSFSASYCPLLGWAELSLAVRTRVPEPDKLFIASKYGRRRFLGGTYSDGWVTGKVRELGAYYELDYDDQPPSVVPVGYARWRTAGIVSLRLTDDGSGMKDYRGYVDGKYVVFESGGSGADVACDLRKNSVRRTGGVHKLKFVATDNCNNDKVFDVDFKY